MGEKGQSGEYSAEISNIFKISKLMSWKQEERITLALKIHFPSKFLLPVSEKLGNMENPEWHFVPVAVAPGLFLTVI